MQLEKKDRLVLINQYNSLRFLDPDSADRYEELIEILENGYQIFYSEVDEFISEDMPGEEGEFVLDILSIYRVVEDYKRNNPNDTDINDHLFSKFRGFDGNNESK